MEFRRGLAIAIAIAAGPAAGCGGDPTPPVDAGGDSHAQDADSDAGDSDSWSDASDAPCDPHACVLWCLAPSSPGGGACVEGLCSCEACDPEGCDWYCATHPPGGSRTGTCESDGSCLCS